VAPCRVPTTALTFHPPHPNVTGHERELVVGQRDLIPWFAKEPTLKFPIHEAHSEELAQKASYKDPWRRGRQCIIPAATFDKPNWETGKNVWWRFRRANGDLWGMAGL
jgi:putative SOS response-associated peptidase YedK